MKDYYYILGIPRDAAHDDIKKAYRKLCLKFHPDKNNGDPYFEQRFKEITEAYGVLTDTGEKRAYDRQLDQQNINYQPKKHSHEGEHADDPDIYATINIKKRDLARRKMYRKRAGKYFFSIAGLSSIFFIIANYKVPESDLTDADLHTNQAASVPYPAVFTTPPKDPIYKTAPAEEPVKTAYVASSGPQVTNSKTEKETKTSPAVIDPVAALKRETRPPDNTAPAPGVKNEREELEQLILGKLKQYTPREIFSYAINNKSEPAYYQDSYTYRFSGNTLVIEYNVYYNEHFPNHFRIDVPIADVDMVYGYEGSLSIGSKAVNIMCNNLTQHAQYATSVFSVKFDLAKEPGIAQKLSEAFFRLKTMCQKHA